MLDTMIAIQASSTSYPPATTTLTSTPFQFYKPGYLNRDTQLEPRSMVLSATTAHQHPPARPNIYRQCNGPCGRTLAYEPRNQADVITHRCPVCMCDTQWMRVTV